MATVQSSPAGTSVGNADGIPVENPATGETIATVPSLSWEQVTAMVARAREAQPGWEQLGFEGRAKLLRRAQKWMMDNSDRVIDVIVSETGKTREDAQVAEVLYVTSALGFWAKMAPEYLADERVRSSNPFVAGAKLVVRYRPLGVVGVIAPWNYPLVNGFGDCIPALAAGNATVLKPASSTPLTSLLMLDMLRECGFPEDVCQVATTSGATAGTLIDEVDYVMFTGSTEVGRQVMERAARTLTPVGLELGGKDPMIVLADANLERAANGAAYYSMLNAGQTCISVERLYVEAPVYDEFVARVTEKVRKLRVGAPGRAGSVDVGAMTSPSQVDVVEDHVADAVAKGATVVAGGNSRRHAGQFFEPTVLTGVDHTMKAMTEETFGPTLPIMKVADVDEAVRLANDSPYGLAASVWTQDLEKGEQVARRVEAGAVCVNDAMVNYMTLELPMGGWKASGLGARHGAGGIRKYCAQQTLLVKRLAPKRDIWMFPNRKLKTRLIGRGLRLLYGRGRRP